MRKPKPSRGHVRGYAPNGADLDPESRLENLQKNHPCTKLLGLWMEAYSEDKGSVGANEDVVFDTEKTKEVTAVMSDVKPID